MTYAKTDNICKDGQILGGLQLCITVNLDVHYIILIINLSLSLSHPSISHWTGFSGFWRFYTSPKVGQIDYRDFLLKVLSVSVIPRLQNTTTDKLYHRLDSQPLHVESYVAT